MVIYRTESLDTFRYQIVLSHRVVAAGIDWVSGRSGKCAGGGT